MYKYVTEDNLEQPQTYMYTEYAGLKFLREFKESRVNFIDMQQEGSEEDFRKIASEVDGWLSFKFKSALDAMDLGDINGDGKESLEFLVKVFELRKRLYSEYQSGYKPNENSDYRRYDYYILLGYLLCQAYRITDNLKYLNTMLKLNDILLSLSNVLDEQQKRCTATLLNREMDFVETLAGQCGIAM